MMDNRDSSALMLEAESQAAGMSCAISLQAVATVPSRWGVWPCLAVEKLSQVELRKECMAYRATLQTADLY
jgi:hypothetical protein